MITLTQNPTQYPTQNLSKQNLGKQIKNSSLLSPVLSATAWGLVTLGMGFGGLVGNAPASYAENSQITPNPTKPVLIAQASTPQMYSTVSLDELEAVVKGIGFLSRKESDRVLRFDGGGYRMFASLESCENNDLNRCRVVVLGTFFKYQPSSTVINEWNRTRYGSTAYLDKDNDATLEASITLVGGITEDNFKAHLLLFVARVEQFSKYIGFPK
jgi:hypothetical protein